MNIMKERRLRGAIPTQQEVAKILGIRASTVSKWENGLSKPRASRLPALAKLYGCYCHETIFDGKMYQAQFDFRQRITRILCQSVYLNNLLNLYKTFVVSRDTHSGV